MPKKIKKPIKDTPLAGGKPMSESKKQKMLAALIRNDAVFEACADRLTADHFVAGFPHSQGYAVVWKALAEFYVNHNMLPTQALLEQQVEDMCNEQPGLLSQEEVEDAEEMVALAFDEELDFSGPAVTKWATRQVVLFLQENLAARAAERIFADDHVVSGGLRDVLAELTDESQQIDALGMTGIGAPLFDEGWQSEKLPVARNLAVDMLNHFMGGEVPGEVTLIAGPYGSCKTLLAVHSAYLTAQLCAKLAELKPYVKKGQRPVVVYASYEMDRREFQRRLLARAAKIPYDRLMKVAQLKKLRQAGEEPLNYEKKKFATQIQNGVPFPSEYERAVEAAELIRKHIVFLDFTGKDKELEGYGKDGVPELYRVMQAYFSANADQVPYQLWIDHTADMGDAYADAHGIDDSAKIAVIRTIPKLLAKLGAHFNIPVYQIHQLSGEANGRGCMATLRVSDMEGCKSLAREATFCLLINKPTDAAGMPSICRVSIAKCRRGKPKSPEVLVRITGRYMRLGLETEYVIDAANRQIVEKSMTEVQSKDSAEAAKKGKKGKKADTHYAGDDEDDGTKG